MTARVDTVFLDKLVYGECGGKTHLAAESNGITAKAACGTRLDETAIAVNTNSSVTDIDCGLCLRRLARTTR